MHPSPACRTVPAQEHMRQRTTAAVSQWSTSGQPRGHTHVCVCARAYVQGGEGGGGGSLTMRSKSLPTPTTHNPPPKIKTLMVKSVDSGPRKNQRPGQDHRLKNHRPGKKHTHRHTHQLLVEEGSKAAAAEALDKVEVEPIRWACSGAPPGPGNNGVVVVGGC